MLNGTKDDKDWLTKKGGYEELMEENLYKHVVKLGHLTSTVCTVGEWRLAKQYLATCGFNPQLLKSWNKPKIGADSQAIATDRAASPTPSRHPSQFPTFSFGRAGLTKQDTQETAYASDNRSRNNASPSAARSRIPVKAAQQRGRALSRATDNVRTSISQKRSASGSFELQANPKRYNRNQVAIPRDDDAGRCPVPPLHCTFIA